MQTVLIVIHLMIVATLIGVVLLQRSEGGGLGMGSGGGSFMSSRGTANLLTRTTAILAAGFFLTSLALSWVAGLDRRPSSIINVPSQTNAPGAPTSPVGSGSLLDQLQKADQNRPATTAPAEPSAPRSQ